MAAMGVSVCGIMMMMMMVMGAAAQAPAPSVDCPTEVFTMTDCLSFVMGSDKAPSANCCSELMTVIKDAPQCLCLLFNTTFTTPLGVNITLAQQLPPLCKLQTPPTSLCSLVGIPVPGPVSSSSPVAPAPATTPSTAPASAPTAASPLSSSSPSPTTAPAGSVPASSPPTMIAPTGPNASTSTPAPNSAPSITSQNAAVAASLLFLASIFLS